MSDLALRRAVAKCAGWEWNYDYAWDSKASQGRLAVEEPLSWDDVMAACEAAGVTNDMASQFPPKWEVTVATNESDGHGSHEERLYALAYALCDACGVAVEDE